MKCAHAVPLCTGSLRLLQQPRSPAARLVSSQARSQRRREDPVLGIPARLPGGSGTCVTGQRSHQSREHSSQGRSPLCAPATKTSQPGEEEVSAEDTSPITRDHVMSLLLFYCASVIAVKWCRKSGDYGRNPCVLKGERWHRMRWLIPLGWKALARDRRAAELSHRTQSPSPKNNRTTHTETRGCAQTRTGTRGLLHP